MTRGLYFLKSCYKVCLLWRTVALKEDCMMVPGLLGSTGSTEVILGICIVFPVWNILLIIDLARSLSGFIFL